MFERNNRKRSTFGSMPNSVVEGQLPACPQQEARADDATVEVPASVDTQRVQVGQNSNFSLPADRTKRWA